ncbi:MAG: ABC transporter ATP-binding protein [Gammaproteobacteria bacterium]|nr:ABC transporter ATP-binding protein [Gammaproteobacteria bacterium]
MSDEILIRAQQITRRYGHIVAIDNISFEVRRGEVVGFLGPNGAGKSTTMKIITGNLAPTFGSVEINGYDIIEHPKEAKAALGYLPETPPLYKDSTVNEYLRFCARLNHIPRPRIKQTIDTARERCGLADVGKRLIGSLSKGYQQRVGIAQAIIHSPSVVILDEPTVGLDPIQIRQIRTLIRELGKDHSVILSTHILPEVQSICDRVKIIHKGKIVLSETMHSLNQKIQSSQTLIALTSPPQHFDELTKIAGVEQIETIDHQHYKIHHHPDHNPANAIVALSVQNNWGLYELIPHKMSLEDVFVDITQQEEVLE